MKKKLLFAAFILAIATLLPKQSKAYDFSAVAPSGQTLYYNIIDGNAEVTYESTSASGYYSNLSGSLTIPSSVSYEGATYTVTKIGSSAFRRCSELTSITIPNTVTVIGTIAFYDCTGLTQFDIPNSVTQIDSYAFCRCTGITSISFPPSLSRIEQDAFYGCTGLTAITIPANVTFIERGAFEYCSNLTSINVESGNAIYDSRENCNAIIKTEDNYLIQGCNTTVIPNSVTHITFTSFAGFPNLTHITIPNSVTYIGSYAFQGSGLTSVVIPSSVTSIYVGAFNGCNNLTSMTVESGNTVFDSRNNCNAIIMTANDSLIAGCQNTVIPNTVTSIGTYAFRGIETLESLVFPASVRVIGNYSFYGASGLTSLTFEGLQPPTLIGSPCFYSCLMFIPCESLDLYIQNMPQYENLFTDINLDFSFVSENINKGTVTITTAPTCPDHTTTIKAIAKNGYHFNHWSDGSTENPYTFTATNGMTLTAYFSADGTQGIEEVVFDGMKIYSRGNEIVVEGCKEEGVFVYDIMGHIVYRGGTEHAIHVNAAGVYMVKVGNRPARKVVVR